MKKSKDPYCVKYKVKDRFGQMNNAKATFKTWDKARKFAQRVMCVECNTGGGSAKLIKWGTNH